jgi:hypothetical protein
MNPLMRNGMIGGAAIVVGVVVYGLFGGGDERPPVAPQKPPAVIIPGQPQAPHAKHSICYNTATGVIVAVVWAGHEWGPGDNTPPLATADVDMPPAFRSDDLPLRRWAYQDGQVVRVKGIDPAPLVVPPQGEPQ